MAIDVPRAREKAGEMFMKLCMFMVAVAFSSAALAIQTASFAGGKVQTTSEIISWGLLLLSGMFGLLHIEKAVYYTKKQADLACITSPPKKDIDHCARLGKAGQASYTLHKLLLVSGLILLGLSRAIVPLRAVIGF